MRFFENGTSIPDLLLERRDEGRVVFFCGAGVSVKQGMPSFRDLTNEIVNQFDPPEDSNIMTVFNLWSKSPAGTVPLDHVYQLLQQEYGHEAINEFITKRLDSKDARSTKLHEHSLIAKISSDCDGTPQIVTTNYDLLFEYATSKSHPSLKRYSPPSLPDLALGMPISGITYLHGRLASGKGHNYPYILSSADFGRAYLVEGWARNFVRSLLSKYTVVLIGYQANDPPIQYLLQGLNHDGRSDRSNLYAFDKGPPENIKSKWQDRGVTSIAYPNHDDLWQTIKAWADRSNDPRKWRQNVINITSSDPKLLKSYERGQVAHLIRTTPGAKQFSTAKTIPHPEWINVFDARTRAAKSFNFEIESFVPLDEYGLDDDQPYSKENSKQGEDIYENLLKWNKEDTNPTTSHRIGGRQLTDIPSRLNSLINWIGKHLNSPAMAWWAARQHGLHPRLIEHIKRQMRAQNLHPKARLTWNMILEYQTDERLLTFDHDWIHLKDRVDREGWTPSVIRCLADAAKPQVFCSEPLSILRLCPPQQDWDAVEIRDVINIEIKFSDRHGEDIKIPSAVLLEIVTILQTNLLQASGMLKEIDVKYFRAPTCYPERNMDKDTVRDNCFHAYIGWFITLFKKLVDYDPQAAATLAILWSTNDQFFFRNLKLFAMNHGDLFNIDQVAQCINMLNDQEFWDENNVRELLFLLEDRWSEFSEKQKITISDRIISGPQKPDYYDNEEFISWRNRLIARYGRRLTLQGCEFPTAQADALDSIIKTIPKWNDEFANAMVTENSGRSGTIVTEDSPDVLLDIPLNKIIERSKDALSRDFNSFIYERPFTGLVKIDARKALAALSWASRKNDYPTDLWTALIQEWPEKAPGRLHLIFMLRLVALPVETVREIRYALSTWLRDKLPTLLKQDRVLAWLVFDHCVSAWTSDNGASAVSNMGKITVGGVVINSSRRTYGHAINGPIGKAAEGIIRSFVNTKFEQAEGIPKEFKTRLEYLLATQGESKDHCVAILTNCIYRLQYIDPNWTDQHLFPLFTFDHSEAEPAWNGLLSKGRPGLEIRIKLKELLKDLFPRIYNYGWGQDIINIGASSLVWMVISRRDEEDGLTIKEARAALRQMNITTRNDLILSLRQVDDQNDNGWKEFVVTFLNDVWPRERLLHTSSSVSSWISLLDGTENDFPAVYNAVKPFLVPVEGEIYWLYHFTKDIDGDQCLTIKHPSVVLDMMDTIIPNKMEYPPQILSQVLKTIEEADDSLVSDPRYIRLLNLSEQN